MFLCPSAKIWSSCCLVVLWIVTTTLCDGFSVPFSRIPEPDKTMFSSNNRRGKKNNNRKVNTVRDGKTAITRTSETGVHRDDAEGTRGYSAQFVQRRVISDGIGSGFCDVTGCRGALYQGEEARHGFIDRGAGACGGRNVATIEDLPQGSEEDGTPRGLRYPHHRTYAVPRMLPRFTLHPAPTIDARCTPCSLMSILIWLSRRFFNQWTKIHSSIQHLAQFLTNFNIFFFLVDHA